MKLTCSLKFYRISLFSDSNLSFADKLVKEDIDSTLECLQMLDKQYSDVKTFYDILLYQTNKGWKCAIDVALNVSGFYFLDFKH